MKVLYILFVLGIVGVYAQRRNSKPAEISDIESSSQRPVSRNRGRTRFSITPEFEQASAEYESITKSTRNPAVNVPRRKPEATRLPVEKRPSPRSYREPASIKSKPYEVKEVIDDIPREDPRKLGKRPRVITETRFEAGNAPKKDLFNPASPVPDAEDPLTFSYFATPSMSESIAEETVLPAQLTTLPLNSIPATEKSTEASLKSTESSEAPDLSEIPGSESEIKKSEPEPPVLSSTKSPEPRKASPHGRLGPRSRSRIEEPSTPATRGRTRSKPLRTETDSATTPSSIPNARSNFRVGRRRSEVTAESAPQAVKARGPSVFASENEQELPIRSRTGRKVSSASDQRASSSEEVRNIGRTRAGRTSTTTNPSERRSSTTNAPSSTNTPEKINSISRSASSEEVRATGRSRGGRIPQSSTTTAPTRRSETRRGSRVTTTAATIEKVNTQRSSGRSRNSKEVETPRSTSRRGNSRSTSSSQESVEQFERPNLRRGRSRLVLPLNEQKLEVLPLFAVEPKTVIPPTPEIITKSSLGRRRSLNSAIDIDVASTKQTEIKLEVDPLNEVPVSSSDNIRISREQSVSVDSKTEKAIRKVYKKRPSYLRSKTTRKPHTADDKEVKQTVSVSEVTEVSTSRRFGRLNAKKESKTEIETNETDNHNTKSTSRLSIRKPSLKLSERNKSGPTSTLTSSEEAITDSDNYPAPFKAALQAKKEKKEFKGLPGSRPTRVTEVSITKTSEDSTTSSTTSTTTITSSEAAIVENIVNDDEEIDRKSETESSANKPPRQKFSLTTKSSRSVENGDVNEHTTNRPTPHSRKYKPKSRPTAATTTVSNKNNVENAEEIETSSSSTPLQKFHARFKSSRKEGVVVTPRPAFKSRSYSPKPPKGLYSSRKLNRSSTTKPEEAAETEKPKRKFNIEKSALSTQAPPTGLGAKKSSRFSSRYRTGTHRSTTSTPQYTPTVPTITPPSPTSVKIEENELGMEIISFDDPIANTVPSANLINGEYLSSSTESSTSSTKTDPNSVLTTNTDRVKDANGANTTEKTISIIERIINSITAMTTTSPDSATKTSTTTNGQPTKSSAILNLVSKRPIKDTALDLSLESVTQKQTISTPNSIDFRTTEKPTTIIERILSSLSAIKADSVQDTTTVDPLQVGSSFNTIDTTPKLSPTESVTTRVANKATTPMSKETSAAITSTTTTTKDSTTFPSASTAPSFSTTLSTTRTGSTILDDISTIPIATSTITARSIRTTTPLSVQTTATTLDPISALGDIASDQTLPKRTIDKLLSLLNIVTPTTAVPPPTTTTKVILVTPKLTTFITSNTESITNTEQNATPVSASLVTTTESATTTTPSASPRTTTPTTFTSSARSDISANEVELQANPLAGIEPTVSTKLFEMLSTLSRIMGINLTSTTSSTPMQSTVTPTMTTAAGVTNPTVTVAGTTPSATMTAASTAPTVTTRVTAGSTVPMTTVTRPPATVTSTSMTTPAATTSPSSSVTSTENAMARELSVVQGLTMPSTQTSATLMTIMNTTPMSTSTGNTAAPLTSTLEQNEVTSASTGTTGSSIITSTSKFTPETTTDTTFDVPSTLPTLANFEVSPDRVSVYSANDISSTFIPDDLSTTVSILARAFFPDTIFSTTANVRDNNVMSTMQPTEVASTNMPKTASSSTMATAPTSSTLSMIMSTMSSNQIDATTPQDVSSNTIDTNSATDKQSLVNQTDVSNLVNPLSAGTNFTVAENCSGALGLNAPFFRLGNGTVITQAEMMEILARNGIKIQIAPNPLQNDAGPTTTTPRSRDYFIFGILPNNTIVRKRPSRFPNNETPYLIYGVLPNNTLVQKFPNGTIVPMEPIIQVVGFDTSENPPSPPEIISNQVTPDQDSRPDNNKVSTGDAQNTIPSVDANQLSTNGRNGSPMTTTSQPSTLPPLTEILGGRTVMEFNNIVNKTNGDNQASMVQTLDVDPMVQSRANLENVEVNTINSATATTTGAPSTTRTPSTMPPTTRAPLVTTTTPQQLPSTTRNPVTTTFTPTTTDAPFTTPLPLANNPMTTTGRTTTNARMMTTGSPVTTTNPPPSPTTTPGSRLITTGFSTTTILPTIFTTILSSLQPRRRITTTTPMTTTTAPVTTTSSPVITSTPAVFTSPLPRQNPSPNPLSISDILSSPNANEVLSNIISSTPSTAALSTTVTSLKDLNLKQRKLTEEQKKDLATLEALEREQEAILKQLAFLTGLNLGPGAQQATNGKDNLAERVIATAMERAKSPPGVLPTGFNLLETLMPRDSRQSKSVTAPTVEEIVKKINANGLESVTSPGPIVTSTYGKTNDALLASLLKEYGVGPATPKVLKDVLSGKETRSTTAVPPKITTTRKRVTTTTTTPAPGRLLQGLNWLLNVFAPQPTKRPQPRKPKVKAEEEILGKQPTEITPVVVKAPDQQQEESKTDNGIISQEQLVALIKKLEEVQKDPSKAQELDIESLRNIKSLQTERSITSSTKGVQVITTSSMGATSRSSTATPKVSSTKSSEDDIKPLVVNRGSSGKSTTALPLGVSNSLLEEPGVSSNRIRSTVVPVGLKDVPGVAADLEAATTKSKIPPVKLDSVPGIPDSNPRIRGQLVNYAINVTKAISSFLGTAIQGAANSFQSMIGSGSRVAGNYRTSDSSNRPG